MESIHACTVSHATLGSPSVTQLISRAQIGFYALMSWNVC